MSKKKSADVILVPIDMSQSLTDQLLDLTKAVKKRNNGFLFNLPGNKLGQVRYDEKRWCYFELKENALNAVLRSWVDPVRWVNNAPRSLPELPKMLVSAYVESGFWPGVPRVRQIAPAPVVRPDWTIAWASGYDAVSETWVTDGLAEPQGDVTPEQVVAARDDLLARLRPFAFEHGEAVADVLALALTPMLMAALPEALMPAGVVKANSPGSGKTQLSQLIGILGSGAQPQPRGYPIESRLHLDITTVLNDGDKRVALYDNVRDRLASGALEALITSRTWADRAMRTHDSIVLPNSTLWLFTMNTPSVSEDMLRRSVLISLDVDKCPDAIWTGRELTEARRDVAHLRTCMATLIRWWIQQGRPAGSAFKSNFEEWAATTSGILEAVGVTGMLGASAKTEVAIDTGREDLIDVIERIARVMNVDRPWKSGDLWDAINVESSAGYTTPDARALREWVKAGDKNGGMAVGHRLTGIRDRQIPGAAFWIESTRNGTSSASYTCREVPGVRPLRPVYHA